MINIKSYTIKIKILSLVIFLYYGFSNLQAQETIPTTGGEASGNNGSVCYTVGQVVFTTQTGKDGNSVAEGVQQPYEISVVTSITQAKDIKLLITVYPNPASCYLTIKVDNYETSNLQYSIYNANGKLLQISKATGKKTLIEIDNLITGIYFLKI